MTSAPLLEVQGLSCRYGDRQPLKSVSLILQPGRILGVTGTPGAGISTLIKAIMRLVAPQAGRVLIGGRPHELASSRSQIAYLPESVRPPGHLSGNDFIGMTRTVQAAVSDGDAEAGLLADLGFDPCLLAYPIRRYAKEDVQKLGLIATLSTGRPLLLLDQPMSGLEPSAQAGLRHRLKRHATDGGAILIGSHAIEDHQDVADHLVMLKDGELADVDAIEVFKTTDAAA